MKNIKNFVFNLSLPLLLAILVTFATKNDYSNVELLNRNIDPPIFYSANVDGGEEKNKEIFEKYKDQIKYM